MREMLFDTPYFFVALHSTCVVGVFRGLEIRGWTVMNYRIHGTYSTAYTHSK